MGTDEGAYEVPDFPAVIIDYEELEVGGLADLTAAEVVLAIVIMFSASLTIVFGIYLFWWIFKV
jgi:hypothetical protein